MHKNLPRFYISIPVLFIVAIALLFLLAPLILETLAERKAAGLGFKDPRLRVRTFNHHALLLNDISIGGAGGPDIKISSLSAKYGLSGLLRGKVERIEVSGLEAKARFQDGELVLQGIPAPVDKKQVQTKEQAPPPIIASYIKIDSSFLDLNIFHNNIRVPFECEFKEKGGPGEYEIRVRSSLLGQEFMAMGNLDINTGNGKFEISVARFDLKSLEFFSSGAQRPLPQGGGGGGIRFALAAWKPEGAQGSLDLRNVNWGQKDFKISGGVRADFTMPDINARADVSSASWGQAELGSPFSCSVSGQVSRELKMECSALILSSPYPASITDLTAKASTDVAIDDIGKWIEKSEIRGEGRVPFQGLFPGLTGPPELIFSFFVLPGKGPEFGLDFEFPESVFPAKTPLHDIHPSLQGINFSGSISAKGGISMNGQGTSSHATLAVKDAALASEDQHVSIEGFNADLKFTDLLNLATGPDQGFRFEKLSWGSIPLSDGKAFFQVEGQESIFLRHGEFKLGNGKIAFDEARFNTVSGEFDAVLSCEDIGLSEMLNLLYAKKIAAGECRISGKVPLRIKNGNAYVSKGSFYSTPGESGVIKIKESGIIFGGNPLVEEAIKEFRYDQVQVDLNSKGEKLNIFMSLKGAPNRTLPLALDPETKNFKRDEKGRGVNLQGLHLELRFNEIPLDELIKKRKLFQEIL
ncbi:MAG: YdbH domain-containing protein [Nitrospinae bacterium]|nr:YdbH domain-containing protein [Nitrospinota bacterium]